MTQSRRISYLDGLRGLAAAVVVIHHMMIGFYPSTYTVDPNTVHTTQQIEYMAHNTPLGIGINGGLAVAIFLVLSGYVVGLAADKPISWSKIVGSGIKRFLRFFVPILTTHGIVVGLLTAGWYWNQAAATITGSHWWLGKMWQFSPSLTEAMAQAFLSLFTMFDLHVVYNSSTWTMPLFFLGPLGLMVVSGLCRPEWLRNSVIGGLMILTLRTHYWPIAAGYLLARGVQRMVKPIPWTGKVLMGVVIVFLGNYPQAYDTAINSSWYRWLPILPFAFTSLFYQTIAALLLLGLLRTSQTLQRFLNTSVLLFLGEISFSLYLFHILVINSVMSGLVVQLTATGLSYNEAFGLSALVSLPIILVGSVLLYRWAEAPVIQLANRVLQ